MQRKVQTKLASRRETYRLWFEYLRLAKRSADKKVIDGLKRSAAFYEPWGDIGSESFQVWWKQSSRSSMLFDGLATTNYRPIRLRLWSKFPSTKALQNLPAS
jgi:hypothetical protein